MPTKTEPATQPETKVLSVVIEVGATIQHAPYSSVTAKFQTVIEFPQGSVVDDVSAKLRESVKAQLIALASELSPSQIVAAANVMRQAAQGKRDEEVSF